MSQQEFDLKISLVSDQQVSRGDLVFRNGAVWVCASKGANLYIDLDTRTQVQFTQKKFMKLHKLELVPISWQINQGKISLQGRQLGMGPTHKVGISWTKSFPELDLVAKQKQKGKQLRHKVILCATTNPKTHLIVGVELL